MTNKKKCKHVCKLCSHHMDDDLCWNFSKDVPNCVTGETDIVYDKCIVHNKEGCCKEYHEDEELVAKDRILKAIKTYQSYRYSQAGCGDSLMDLLCRNLENAILGVETNFYYNSDRNRYYYKYNEDGNYTNGYKKSQGYEDDKKKKKFWCDEK